MNTLVKTFGHQKRWVEWRAETRDGKTTKVPLGKSDTPSTWHTYDALPQKEMIGLMFGLHKKLLGIDIDKCLIDGKLEGKNSVEIATLLAEANTYCEVSPSGTGLHLFLQITEPLELKANRKDGYECYTTGRYFTVTQNPFGDEKEVRTVTIEEAEKMLSIIGYPWKKVEAKAPLVQNFVASTDDEELIKIMFKGKTGTKIKMICNTVANEGVDMSVMDMQLLAHLAFYTQGNADQMERIWMSMPIGQRQKTQERKDYRERSITNAIANCKEFYTPKKVKEAPVINMEVQSGFDEIGLQSVTDGYGKKKYPVVAENINIILENHPKFTGRFRYNEFLLATQIKINDAWEIQRDIHELVILSEISQALPMFNSAYPIMVKNAIAKVAHDHSYDSAKDYIGGLVWDKTERIDVWLQNVFGIEDTDYTRKVGSNWLKGLVDRLINPGCQFDYILVVEGKQGMKKSSAFRELVTGDWHLETERSPGEKDFFVEMAGKAIVELSEGQSNATVDVKKMKSIITKRKDTYRSPYGRVAEDHPRRSVFCMTTNDDDYLKDTTGDRRWLPVECTKMADTAWVRENRDQLFAEAAYRLNVLKETTFEFPEDIALEKQEDRRFKDPNTDAIVVWYRTKCGYYAKKQGLTVLDVFIGALCDGIRPANVSMSKLQQMSIASVLKTTLKLEKIRDTSGDRLYKYYDPTLEGTMTIADLPIKDQLLEQHKEKTFFEQNGF
jgi:hypothetical protein